MAKSTVAFFPELINLITLGDFLSGIMTDQGFVYKSQYMQDQQKIIGSYM